MLALLHDKLHLVIAHDNNKLVYERGFDFFN